LAHERTDEWDGPERTQHSAGLELEPVLVLRIADQGVKFPRPCKSTLYKSRFDTGLGTHAAESYQRSMRGLFRARSTPARSAVFHRTCVRWCLWSEVVWPRIGKPRAGCMLTPSFPLAWANCRVLLRHRYAPGHSSLRRAAMLKPSTRDESPPLPSVWERRCSAWRPWRVISKCDHGQGRRPGSLSDP
jgi:hypothetical protein